MSDNINIQSQSTDPPSEPLTREEQYLSAIAGVTSSEDIPEKPLTREEKYLNKIVENGGGGGGGGFTPTDAQLDAMNSGITSEDVEQISTNQNNISLCKAFTDNATIDSDRKLYISATKPTGDIPQGSTWIDGKTIKTYGRSDNLWDESYPNISSAFQYIGINVGTGQFTLSTTMPQTEYAALCFLAGNVSAGASTSSNGVWNGQNRTVTAVDGYVTIAYRIYGQSPANYNTMLNAGDTAETYQSYYDWV